MSNELMITKGDLESAGISGQLTTNDLIEVIASDIFDKYVNNVNAIREEEKKLCKMYEDAFSYQLQEMKEELTKAKIIGVKDECVMSWDGNMKYTEFDTVYVYGLKVKEELQKGMIVTKNDNRSHSFIVPKKDKAAIRLHIEVRKDTTKEVVKVKGIEGYIETAITKDFKKEILISSSVLKQIGKYAGEFNKKVNEVIDFLPQNGVLSVERFVREARVKLNKKMLASQPTEFKKKMFELFKIQL